MIYEKVKQLRLYHNKTQQELAEFLHLSRSAYSNYENNIREIPVPVLSKIAEYYNTSVDYLIGRTDEMQAYPKSPSPPHHAPHL